MWLGFAYPVKEIRKEIPELLINGCICIIGVEFKPGALHNAKA